MAENFALKSSSKTRIFLFCLQRDERLMGAASSAHKGTDSIRVWDLSQLPNMKLDGSLLGRLSPDLLKIISAYACQRAPTGGMLFVPGSLLFGPYLTDFQFLERNMKFSDSKFVGTLILA